MVVLIFFRAMAVREAIPTYMTLRKPVARQRARRFHKVGTAVFSLLLAGCAGTVHRKTTPPSAPAELTLGSSTVLKHPRHEVITELDLNQDQKADVWSYRIPSRGPDGRKRELLLRKELDINGDGRVDVIRFYDADERLVREAIDLDFDGRIDQLNHYQQELVVLKERDTNGDGRADEWRHFARGQLVRSEQDTDRDGLPDSTENPDGGSADLEKVPEFPEPSPAR